MKKLYFFTPFFIGLTIGILASLDIIVGPMLACIIFCFMMIRLWWVGKQRINIINERFEDYLKYEDFDTMNAKFWIWDVEKFRKC